MKIIFTLAIVVFISIFSVEFERHTFQNIEFFKAECKHVVLSISSLEKQVILAEKNIEISLEGGSNGLN